MFEWISDIVLAAGGTAVVVAGLAGFLAKIIFARIKQNHATDLQTQKTESAKELEAEKAQSRIALARLQAEIQKHQSETEATVQSRVDTVKNLYLSLDNLVRQANRLADRYVSTLLPDDDKLIELISSLLRVADDNARAAHIYLTSSSKSKASQLIRVIHEEMDAFHHCVQEKKKTDSKYVFEDAQRTAKNIKQTINSIWHELAQKLQKLSGQIPE